MINVFALRSVWRPTWKPENHKAQNYEEERFGTEPYSAWGEFCVHSINKYAIKYAN